MSNVKVKRKSSPALEKLIKRMKKDRKIRAGFLKGATYPTGESVAQVAAKHNYGDAKTPARPFMNKAMKDNNKKWAGLMEKALKGEIEKKAIGAIMVGDIKKSIKSGNFIKNSQATIERKGFNKPLIDTSHMLNSIDFEVVE